MTPLQPPPPPDARPVIVAAGVVLGLALALALVTLALVVHGCGPVHPVPVVDCHGWNGDVALPDGGWARCAGDPTDWAARRRDGGR